MMENVDPLEYVLFACKHFDLKVKDNTEKIIHLENDYTIEIEGVSLFKLMQGGQVIAPFADVEEMCKFIKMDIALNEEN